MVDRATCAARAIAMRIGVARAVRASLLMTPRGRRALRLGRHAARRRHRDDVWCAPVVVDIDVDLFRASCEGSYRAPRAVARAIIAEEKNDEWETSSRGVVTRLIERLANVFRDA